MRITDFLPEAMRVALHATKLRFGGGGGDTRKRQIVVSYLRKHGISCFIETGSLVGDMVDAVRPWVDRVYSIELDEYLFKVCRQRFSPCGNVTILHGDSGEILRQLLPGIDQTVLFWLDAHFSEGGTARGELDTPILEELAAVGDHHIKDHIILVDDVRCFGEGDFPNVDALCDLIKGINSDYRIRIEADILRAVVR